MKPFNRQLYTRVLYVMICLTDNCSLFRSTIILVLSKIQ